MLRVFISSLLIVCSLCISYVSYVDMESFVNSRNISTQVDPLDTDMDHDGDTESTVYNSFDFFSLNFIFIKQVSLLIGIISHQVVIQVWSHSLIVDQAILDTPLRPPALS